MAAACAALSLCISNLMHSPVTQNHGCKRLFLGEGHRIVHLSVSLSLKKGPSRSRFYVFALTEGSAKSSDSEETLPSWAKPDSEEPPPWAREEGSGNASQQNFELPFFVYLLSSAIAAIAAIGSAFEYVNQKPVFGILNADSVFYAPVLGFFAFTGIPTSAFLWFKSVQAANKEAEEQDRRDMALSRTKMSTYADIFASSLHVVIYPSYFIICNPGYDTLSGSTIRESFMFLLKKGSQLSSSPDYGRELA